MNYEKFGVKNSEQLVKDILKRKFDMIILDEAHRIKNRKAKSTKNIFKLTKIPKRLVLTATPGHDKPEDIWSLLHFLYPDIYTSYYKWADYWLQTKVVYTPRGAIEIPCGIKKHLKDQFALELSKIAIMRKRKDVMSWTYEPDVIDIPLETGKLQQKHLDELEQWYETDDVVCSGVLDRLIRYRQICNMPAILNLSGDSPKEKWILSYIKENPDKHILIFSSSVLSLKRLNSIIPSSQLIYGDVALDDRQAIVDEFQNGGVKILLLQTQSCKEGLTLDRADDTIFLDLYPPAADYQQAKDRMIATSPDRVKPQNIYRLYMQSTFDESCIDMVDRHISQTDVLNNFKNYIRRNKDE